MMFAVLVVVNVAVNVVDVMLLILLLFYDFQYISFFICSLFVVLYFDFVYICFHVMYLDSFLSEKKILIYITKH